MCVFDAGTASYVCFKTFERHQQCKFVCLFYCIASFLSALHLLVKLITLSSFMVNFEALKNCKQFSEIFITGRKKEDYFAPVTVRFACDT